MKKLFLLASVAFILSANAQIDSKKIDAKATKVKAVAALKTKKSSKGASAFTAGDDCGAFTKTTVDKDGVSYQESKDFIIVSSDGVTGLGFTMSNFVVDGDKYLLLIGVSFEKGFCVGKGTTKIIITFTDGEQATLTNYQADNCDGIVKAIVGKKLANEGVMDQFKTKTIRSIKIEGVEKTVVKPLTENNQIQFQGTVKCL